MHCSEGRSLCLPVGLGCCGSGGRLGQKRSQGAPAHGQRAFLCPRTLPAAALCSPWPLAPVLLLQLPRSLLAAAVETSFPPSPAALLLSIPCPWRVTKCHLFISLLSCKAILWEGSSTQPALGSGTPRSIPRRLGLSELQQGHSCVLSAWTRSHPQCWLLKWHNKITSREQDVPANHGFAGLSAAT